MGLLMNRNFNIPSSSKSNTHLNDHDRTNFNLNNSFNTSKNMAIKSLKIFNENN